MKLSNQHRSVAILLMLCLVLAALASCTGFSDTEYAIVSENNVSADGFIYDKYENSTVKITGIETMPALLVIPAEIDGMTVVEIADSAFEGNETLLYLELPATPIKLGRKFCCGCKSLMSVDLSGSVTVLPDNAFEDCSNLSLIDGIGSVTEIGSQSFAGCRSLSSIAIPESLVSIGSEAFRGCSSLSSVVLPKSLSDIGDSAFWGCESLVTLTVHSSVNIPQYCFLDCIRLTEVKLGDNVEAIGTEAFRNCRKLYSITFGKKITEIGDYAFHACDSLAEIVFTNKKASVTVGEGNGALGLSN